MVLRLVDVYKYIGGDTILNGAELEVGEGEIIVVKGRSGVGKTTLAKIASLLVKPDRGSVYFMGRDATSINEYERSLIRLRKIGYIDQEYRLLPRLRVYENIELPLALLGYPREARWKIIMEVVELLEIKGLENRFPHELSGGQRQRAAIARALVKKPALIVADEPFSNLDEYSAERVLGVFKEMAKDGTAILITTTEMEAEYGATRYYVLKGGRLYVD
ncbi:MAG: ABC transporter ATP-binding protein [Desulfurococcus sp.]|jgi:putative ABC transport system ATP-binding protein|uniref:ABC transporter ATP-binding protein n=1 Tax=Desulfurococcus sp. TaxID=51678 RepID=UPI003166054C